MMRNTCLNSGQGKTIVSTLQLLLDLIFVAMVKRTNFDQLFVNKNQTVIEAIKVIDSGCRQIALVVDDDRRLVGILTDGDVRRAILNKVALEAPINKIMKDKFTHLVSPAIPRRHLVS